MVVRCYSDGYKKRRPMIDGLPSAPDIIQEASLTINGQVAISQQVWMWEYTLVCWWGVRYDVQNSSNNFLELLWFVSDSIKVEHVWWYSSWSDIWGQCPQVLCICTFAYQEKTTSETWWWGTATLNMYTFGCTWKVRHGKFEKFSS